MPVREKLLTAVLGADPEERRPLVRALTERFGAEILEAEIQRIASGGASRSVFSRGLRRACDLPETLAQVRLWFGMYPGTLGLLVGDTGVGKSTLLYGLCLSMASSPHASYYDIPFDYSRQLARPLNILYFDPENAGGDTDGGNCRLKIDRIIGDGEPVPDRLVFHDGQDTDLSNPQQLADFELLITQPGDFIPGWAYGPFDLVVLDPLANLYSIDDENNNALAAKRAKDLLKIAKRTRATILQVHHESPKSGTAGSGYGRGATATLAAVDWAFLIRAKEDTEEMDDDVGQGAGIQRTGLLRWQLVKNRRGGKGSLYLEMLGYDRFERRTHADWKKAGGDNGMPKAARCKEEILILTMDGRGYSIAQIVAHAVNEGMSDNMARTSIRNLEAEGQLVKRMNGNNALYYNAEVIAARGVGEEAGGNARRKEAVRF